MDPKSYKKKLREYRQQAKRQRASLRKKNPEAGGLDYGETLMDTGGMAAGAAIAGPLAARVSSQFMGRTRRGLKAVIYFGASAGLVGLGKYLEDRVEDLPVYPFFVATATATALEGMRTIGLIRSGGDREVQIEVEDEETGEATQIPGELSGGVVRIDQGVARQIAGGLLNVGQTQNQPDWAAQQIAAARRATGEYRAPQQIAGGLIKRTIPMRMGRMR